MAIKRKNNSSPVSLFAFQDIITSITGIMILVVIIFILQLINRKLTHQQNQDTSKLKAAEKIIDNQIFELEKLQELISDVESFNKKIEGNPDELLKKMNDMLKELERLIARKKNIENERRKVVEELDKKKLQHEKILRKLKDVQAKLEAHKKQLATEKQKQKNAFKKSVFAIKSHANKSPVLILCGGSSIRVLADKGENEVIFRDSSSNMYRSLNKLSEYIKSRSKSSEYLVVLVCPESAGYISSMKLNGFDVSYVPIKNTDIFSPEVKHEKTN